MGRSKISGFRFFPLDTGFAHDHKVLRLSRRDKEATLFYIELLCVIFDSEHMYYYPWDEDSAFALGRITLFEEEKVNEIMDLLLELDFVDRDLFTRENVVTSRGIQRQYLAMCKLTHREPNVDFRYNLLEENEATQPSEPQNEIPSEIFGNIPDSFGLKESKINQSKLNYYSCNTHARACDLPSEEEQEEILLFDAFFRNWLKPAEQLSKLIFWNNQREKSWHEMTWVQKQAAVALWRPKDPLTNKFVCEKRFPENFLPKWFKVCSILYDTMMPQAVRAALFSDRIAWKVDTARNIATLYLPKAVYDYLLALKESKNPAGEWISTALKDGYPVGIRLRLINLDKDEADKG